MYNLVADFPTGTPACFTDALCASKANESAFAFFQHWSNLRFARQSTNLMHSAFGHVDHDAPTKATAGQLGALLLSLQLMGQAIVHATTAVVSEARSARGRRLRSAATSPRAAENVTISRIVLRTPRFRVAYHSMVLRSDPSEHPSATKQFWPCISRWAKGGPFLDLQLETLVASLEPSELASSGRGMMYVSMFKAAPHWILRNEWAARWVLSRSVATLHDETGLRPQFYNGSVWATRHFGSFREFEHREVKWYPGEKAELIKYFHDENPLPFQFGYAQTGGHGVLMTAWRREMA